MIDGELVLWAACVAASSGTHVVTGSSSRRRPSSRSRRTAAAVKLLVIEAIREAAVTVGWRVGPDAERAVAPRVRQAAVDDDPVGEARDEIALGEPLEEHGVHLGQGVAQGHATRLPSGRIRDRHLHRDGRDSQPVGQDDLMVVDRSETRASS